MNHITAVAQKQVARRRKIDIALRTDRGQTLANDASPTTTVEYIKLFYIELKEVTGSRDSRNLSVKKGKGIWSRL